MNEEYKWPDHIKAMKLLPPLFIPVGFLICVLINAFGLSVTTSLILFLLFTLFYLFIFTYFAFNGVTPQYCEEMVYKYREIARFDKENFDLREKLHKREKRIDALLDALAKQNKP